jgi:hypothetical protein
LGPIVGQAAEDRIGAPTKPWLEPFLRRVHGEHLLHEDHQLGAVSDAGAMGGEQQVARPFRMLDGSTEVSPDRVVTD